MCLRPVVLRLGEKVVKGVVSENRNQGKDESWCGFNSHA